MSEKISVVFVCLGNICRSPTAEAIFLSVVEEAGLKDRFLIDSAGTLGYHDGDPPDKRSQAEAKRRGLSLNSRARTLTREDLGRFDHVVVMDSKNLEAVHEIAGGEPIHAEVSMLRDHDGSGGDVPDPYFGGDDGFPNVFDICDRGCRALLSKLQTELNDNGQ